MKFYVSVELDKVLTEKEYKELLNREVKEYGYSSIEEAEEKDADYTKVIEIEEDLEGKLYHIDNILQSNIYGYNTVYTEPSMCDNVSDTIDNQNFSYAITDNWNINVKFEIIELDEEHLEDSCIKVTDIELI